jgi:hypothetical protein
MPSKKKAKNVLDRELALAEELELSIWGGGLDNSLKKDAADMIRTLKARVRELEDQINGQERFPW